MVCNFCNGICDSFVMVFEFSVMVLLFFSAGLPHYFYIMHFKSFYRLLLSRCTPGARNEEVRNFFETLYFPHTAITGDTVHH